MKPTVSLTTIPWIVLILFLAAACAPATPPTLTPPPTLTLAQTSLEPFPIDAFDGVHAPAADDPNKFLFFGALPVQAPAADLPKELAVFLGRWEGYNFGGAIKKDEKLVVVVEEITPAGGTAVSWAGFNLQTPGQSWRHAFRVVTSEAGPALEAKLSAPGVDGKFSLTYDPKHDRLEGWIETADGAHTDGPIYLTREKKFFIYQDYPAYLASKGITIHAYKNELLKPYGAGYMLYLPAGYADQPDKKWPLIFFLHGSGDRGSNIQVLAKASPFMYIREQGPLDAIIAAPLLTDSDVFPGFPEEYMDGALAEVLADYRVEARRVYLTGLSLGGEAAWRFALHQPRTFAVVAPLCAFLNNPDPEKMKAIADVPVWAIHGADDIVVFPSRGQAPVEALKQAGGNVKFTLLPAHDHDVWTDTYSDPAFYEWLLGQQKP